MPHPSAKVARSTPAVLMPTASAMGRFCTTARTFLPQPERYISRYTANAMDRAMTITNRPLMGISTRSVTWKAPIIHSGRSTPTSRAPKIDR